MKRPKQWSIIWAISFLFLSFHKLTYSYILDSVLFPSNPRTCSNKHEWVQMTLFESRVLFFTFFFFGENSHLLFLFTDTAGYHHHHVKARTTPWHKNRWTVIILEVFFFFSFFIIPLWICDDNHQKKAQEMDNVSWATTSNQRGLGHICVSSPLPSFGS